VLDLALRAYPFININIPTVVIDGNRASLKHLAVVMNIRYPIAIKPLPIKCFPSPDAIFYKPPRRLHSGSRPVASAFITGIGRKRPANG
jgi:hypothetical protein